MRADEELDLRERNALVKMDTCRHSSVVLSTHTAHSHVSQLRPCHTHTDTWHRFWCI